LPFLIFAAGNHKLNLSKNAFLMYKPLIDDTVIWLMKLLTEMQITE